MPGIKTPSFPFGGAMLTGLRIQRSPLRLEYFVSITTLEMMEQRVGICKVRFHIDIAKYCFTMLT
jgi:hypothetical protein